MLPGRHRGSPHITLVVPESEDGGAAEGENDSGDLDRCGAFPLEQPRERDGGDGVQRRDGRDDAERALA
jgi:hypothetical protein